MIAYIMVVSDFVDDYKVAEDYGFTTKQYEMLIDLLNEKKTAMLAKLVGRKMKIEKYENTYMKGRRENARRCT